MNRSQLVLTSAALVAGCLLSSASADLVFLAATTSGSTTNWTQYASLADLASNTGGSSAGSAGASLLSTDGIWTDGVHVYKTTADATGVAGTYNNLYVRYNSLADLNADAGGTVFNMTQGMYYNEDVIAGGTNGWVFRTASFGGASNIGMYAFGDLANLLANSSFYAAGFAAGPVDGANQFWAYNGTYYGSNVVGGAVTGFTTWPSGPDLYNGTNSVTIGSTGFDASARFLAIDSSLIGTVPAPSAIALLGLAGVGISRRRRA